LDRVLEELDRLKEELDFATVDYRHKDAAQIITFPAFSRAIPFGDQ
jgi:hypothetical protein